MTDKPIVVLSKIARGKWLRDEVATFQLKTLAVQDALGVETIWDTVDVYMTDCARNKSVARAKEFGASVLIQVDDDMVPHLGFYERAVRFLLENLKAVVVSPYLCAKGSVKVCERVGGNLVDVPREDAFARNGWQQVYAAGTGLIAYGMQAFDALTHPYFACEYTDSTHSEMSASEDIVCTRNLTLAGVPVWCDWDCWSGHAKENVMSRPAQAGPSAYDEMRHANGCHRPVPQTTSR